MVALRQSSFSGGLIGPQLLGRSDLQKYASGLRTCMNLVVTRHGTFENRAGTTYVDTVADQSNTVRLVRFGSTVGQGLLLEFSNLAMRVFKNGGPVQHATTLGAYAGGTTYTRSQVVTYGGLQYLSLVNSNVGHQPDISPAFWYVQPASGAYELPTPIAQAALGVFQYAQINDLMYVAAQAFYPQVLSHFADNDWSFDQFVPGTGIAAPASVTASSFTPSSTLGPPAGITASPNGTPAVTYKVTSYRFSPASNSVPSAPVAANDPSAGNVTISWSAAALANGYAIYRSTAGGPWGLVGVTSGTSFIDRGIETSADGATPVAVAPSSSGGSNVFQYVVTAISASTAIESLASSVASCSGNTPSAQMPNTISWSAVTGASSYNIYKSTNGIFGFIGNSSTTSFSDVNYISSISQQPPVAIPLFQTASDYPAVVGSFQQRLMFANTVNQSQTVWASAVGVYTNFSTTVPVLDSGSIQFTIAGRVRQYVHALVDIGRLIINTSNGEYVAAGNQFGQITPTAINLAQHGYAGSSLFVPISIGSTALFVQSRGNIIRDLQYSIQTTSYTGKDTTLYVPHLFENRQVVQMDWQQVYDSIIWCVMDDGKLLGMSYIRDQEMWAWHEHVFASGAVEQVCVVQESTHDIVYLVVKRTVNGATKRYIERMNPRQFTDTVNLSDAIFTDASLTYDGRNTGATTMTVTTGAGWTPQDNLTITASSSTFSAGDVGNTIVLQQLDTTGVVTDQIRFDIIAYTSATVVTAHTQGVVPAWAKATATTAWGKAVHAFTGIDHLEGLAISAQGDGAVVASALNDRVPTVVTGGAFMTPDNYLVLTAGLPITAQMQTLPWEGGGRTETTGNKASKITEATVTLYNTRGGKYGADFSHLFPWKQRGLAFEPMSTTPALFTGPTIVPVSGTWSLTPALCIQQDDPLPLAVSSVIPTGSIAGN